MKKVITIGLTAIIAYAAIMVLVFNSVMFCRVNGESMSPTLKNNSFGCIKLNDRDFKHGDIVVIKLTEDEKIVKRIIGVPGDVVEINFGRVVVNGQELNEDYVKYYNSGDNGYEKLGDGCYYVMGDNRYDSLDSRYFGPIDESKIIGKFVGLGG